MLGPVECLCRVYACIKDRLHLPSIQTSRAHTLDKVIFTMQFKKNFVLFVVAAVMTASAAAPVSALPCLVSLRIITDFFVC